MTDHEFYARVMRENLYRDEEMACPDWIMPGQCPLELVKAVLPLGKNSCLDAFKQIHDKYKISEKLELI